MSYIPAVLEADEQERKLFIGGLNKIYTTEDRLRKFFAEYGKIVDVTIMRDTDKQSRGFGFVLFENASSVDDIIAKKKTGSQFTLDEHHIEVKRALPKVPGGNAGSSRTGGLYRKIFVGGLPSSITEEDLKDHFSRFGPVHEIDLLRDRETNRLRGFAFVTFEDEDSADKCIQKRAQEICKKLCEVKRAQTRSTLTKYENEEQNRNRSNNDAGGAPNPERFFNKFNNSPVNSLAPSSGMMSMSEVNQLIQQAYLMGQQSVLQNTGLQQAPSAASLLGLNNMQSYNPNLNNTLIHALMTQQQAAAVPPVPASLPNPIAPPQQTAAAAIGQASNASANNPLNQLAQLLNGKGIDANALTALLKQDESGRSPGKSNGPNYSTSYPSSYDMYYNSQQGSNYGPSSKDDEKRPNYRPY